MLLVLVVTLVVALVVDLAVMGLAARKEGHVLMMDAMLTAVLLLIS